MHHYFHKTGHRSHLHNLRHLRIFIPFTRSAPACAFQIWDHARNSRALRIIPPNRKPQKFVSQTLFLIKVLANFMTLSKLYNLTHYHGYSEKICCKESSTQKSSR